MDMKNPFSSPAHWYGIVGNRQFIWILAPRYKTCNTSPSWISEHQNLLNVCNVYFWAHGLCATYKTCSSTDMLIVALNNRQWFSIFLYADSWDGQMQMLRMKVINISNRFPSSFHIEFTLYCTSFETMPQCMLALLMVSSVAWIYLPEVLNHRFLLGLHDWKTDLAQSVSCHLSWI